MAGAGLDDVGKGECSIAEILGEEEFDEVGIGGFRGLFGLWGGFSGVGAALSEAEFEGGEGHEEDHSGDDEEEAHAQGHAGRMGQSLTGSNGGAMRKISCDYSEQLDVMIVKAETMQIQAVRGFPNTVNLQMEEKPWD